MEKVKNTSKEQFGKFTMRIQSSELWGQHWFFLVFFCDEFVIKGRSWNLLVLFIIYHLHDFVCFTDMWYFQINFRN